MPPNPSSTDADARYQAGLQLVLQLNARLAYGRPITDRHGRPMHELDQVVRAILADDLSPLPQPGGGPGWGSGEGVR